MKNLPTLLVNQPTTDHDACDCSCPKPPKKVSYQQQYSRPNGTLAPLQSCDADVAANAHLLVNNAIKQAGKREQPAPEDVDA